MLAQDLQPRRRRILEPKCPHPFPDRFGYRGAPNTTPAPGLRLGCALDREPANRPLGRLPASAVPHFDPPF